MSCGNGYNNGYGSGSGSDDYDNYDNYDNDCRRGGRDSRRGCGC